MNLRHLFILFLLLIFACQQKPEQKSETSFYIGTYTNGESEGIYKYKINSKGYFSKIGFVAKTNNPSFLTKTSDNKYLLAVDETDANGTGFVKSFKIGLDTLQHLSSSKSGGAHPCFIYLSINKDVLVANYSGGNIGYLQLKSNGKLTPLLDIQKHEGKGITSRQEAPHAHSVWLNPYKKNEVIAADLGTNELWFSKIDRNTKALHFSNPKKVKMKNGAGPRHLAFHSKNNLIYVLNELNNTVSLIKENKGKYTIEFEVSTLPDTFTDYNTAAEIKITKDGKFLYASNRGHQSITCFKIDQNTGKLTTISYTNTRGITPRNFSLTPNERYLVIANQDSNSLVSFQRNLKTGQLSFINEIKVPSPVYVLF